MTPALLVPVVRALAVLSVAGCSAAPLPEDAYAAAVTAAARAERADRFAEAADFYERAAGLTSDGMIARTALYRSAQAAQRAGQYDRALAGFFDLADRWPGTPEAGRGLYDAAQLLRRLGREEDAVDVFVRLIRREPGSAMTSVGVRRLLQIFEDRDDLAALDRILTAELEAATDREVRVVLRYFRALGRADENRVDDALADLEAAGAECEYPDCSYWDDLPWRAAHVCRAARRFSCALDYLDRMLDLREESWLNGSYYSNFYDDAQYLKGEILRADLGRPEEAAAVFLELEDFTDSTMCDDGLWAAALIYLDDLDDADRGCDILRDLMEDYPDSNLRRRAAARLDVAPCAGQR